MDCVVRHWTAECGNCDCEREMIWANDKIEKEEETKKKK